MTIRNFRAERLNRLMCEGFTGPSRPSLAEVYRMSPAAAKAQLRAEIAEEYSHAVTEQMLNELAAGLPADAVRRRYARHRRVGR